MQDTAGEVRTHKRYSLWTPSHRCASVGYPRSARSDEYERRTARGESQGNP